jgi:hypothetical protein
MSQRAKRVDQDLTYQSDVTSVRREASLDHAKQQRKLEKSIKRA